jgi:hypothetical protein
MIDESPFGGHSRELGRIVRLSLRQRGGNFRDDRLTRQPFDHYLRSGP